MVIIHVDSCVVWCHIRHIERVKSRTVILLFLLAVVSLSAQAPVLQQLELGFSNDFLDPVSPTDQYFTNGVDLGVFGSYAS